MRNYLANKLEEARRALLSSMRAQDRVIGRQESYRAFVHFEQYEVEDEVYPGDFPHLDARGLAPAPLLAVQGLDSIHF